MAAIQLQVNVLDEHCVSCRCLDVTKQELYSYDDVCATEYSCSNLHMCRYIRNRIVRNDLKDKPKDGWDDHIVLTEKGEKDNG